MTYKCGRPDAHPCSLEVAIPAFLTPVDFVIDEDGAHHVGQVYRSNELEQSGLCDRALVNKGGIKVEGYGLTG